MHLKARACCEQVLIRKLLSELMLCLSVRNPGLYLLSDDVLCFAADLKTMKRPPSFLFSMQASTG